MSTTKSQLIYDLWQVVSPLISDDSVLDERSLSYWVDVQRSLWLRNELNKNRTIDDNIQQSLGAVQFEVVDRVENMPYTGTNSKIIKSKLQIPVAIELHNSTAITRVGSLDITCRPFKLIDYTAVPFSGNGKFNKNEIFAFLKGGYMYAISDCNNPAWKALKYMNIRGVFEKPEEASIFSHIDGTACWTTDSAYPINKWVLGYLKDAIIKLDLRPFIQPLIDESNNASAESQQINTNN
jgi:hypothetical protein